MSQCQVQLTCVALHTCGGWWVCSNCVESVKCEQPKWNPNTIVPNTDRRTMGPIHSNSRDKQSTPNDLHLVRQEVEKLFAMDSHNHGLKPHTACKGHQNSNRWNILRFLESVKKETILGNGKLDVTAASSCCSSPNLPKFPQLSQRRGHMEDSRGNLTIVNSESPCYMQPGEHDLQKSKGQDFSINVDCGNKSQVSCLAGRNALPTHQPSSEDTDSIIASSKGRSRPIPVSRRRVSPTNVMNNEESYMDDAAEENHLKQIYDLRTWEMYIRISEARKKAAKSKPFFNHRNTCISNTVTSSAATMVNPCVPLPPVGSTLLPQGVPHFHMNNVHMIPYLPKDDTSGELSRLHPSPNSEHEMIFGDLDD